MSQIVSLTVGQPFVFFHCNISHMLILHKYSSVVKKFGGSGIPAVILGEEVVWNDDGRTTNSAAG